MKKQGNTMTPYWLNSSISVASSLHFSVLKDSKSILLNKMLVLH